MPSITRFVDEIEEKLIDDLLRAVRGKCDVEIPGNSTLVNERFAREFRAELLIRHYFIRAPLETSSFEAAFFRASQAAGHEVKPAPTGQRFWDIEVNGMRLSLKTTRQKQLRVNKLHISKLCEAAWIQDDRRASTREIRTKRLFSEYTRHVDSIIQLRLFETKALYELVEIPSALLVQVSDVPRAAFSADGPTINIPIGKEPPDFTLKIDRSDAKITLANINKSVCDVLGTWQLS